MSTEVSFDSSDNDYLILEFARNVGIEFPVEWEGRQVSGYAEEVQQRILNLFQCLVTDAEQSDRTAIYLAIVGTLPKDRDLLKRDIQQLICTSEGVVARGFNCRSGVSKFWKEHKKPILIGAGIIAVVVAAGAFIVYTGGTGAQIAGTAAAVALDSLLNGEKVKGENFANSFPPVPETVISDPELLASKPTSLYDFLDSTAKEGLASPYEQWTPLPNPSIFTRTLPDPTLDSASLNDIIDTLEKRAREATVKKSTEGEAKEDRHATYKQIIETLETGREIAVYPGAKPSDNYASYAYSNSVTGDYNSPPPFQEIPIQGYPDQSTVHFHCGINNNLSSVVEGSSCLYKTLNEEFAIQPHLIHPNNILTGLGLVALEKLDEISKDPALPSLTPRGPLELPGLILQNSVIQRSIDYEVESLSKIAQNIREKNNPNLKQLHVTFSNGGYVFNEALKQLPPEDCETIIVITAGTTAIINNDLAFKVYNIIGDKDLASQLCNHGIENILGASERADIEIIPQNETQDRIGGHYFMQPDYQDGITKIINEKIVGQYEIY